MFQSVQGAELDCESLYLVHDGVLRVCGLHDGGLHKVALLIVTLSPGNDFEVRRRLGVIDPLLYPSERLQQKHKRQVQRQTSSRHRQRRAQTEDCTLSSITAEKKVLKSSMG